MLGIGSILANEAINEATSKIIVPVIAKNYFKSILYRKDMTMQTNT